VHIRQKISEKMPFLYLAMVVASREANLKKISSFVCGACPKEQLHQVSKESVGNCQRNAI